MTIAEILNDALEWFSNITLFEFLPINRLEIDLVIGEEELLKEEEDDWKEEEFKERKVKYYRIFGRFIKILFRRQARALSAKAPQYPVNRVEPNKRHSRDSGINFCVQSDSEQRRHNNY